ncbi:hypothetical protein D3C85_1210770 [compost metagenome]
MHADAERTFLRCQPVLQCFQLRQDSARGCQHLFALRRQSDMAAIPHKHRQAEMTLQLLDFPAHCALGQAQRLRSLGEAAGVGDFDQCLQGLQRSNVANFIHAFYEWLNDFITLVVLPKA